MIFPFFISIITFGFLWYVISLSLSWLIKIRFKLQSRVKATLCNSIFPVESGKETIPTSSIWMIWPAAVRKSILLTFILINSLQLLHKWLDAYESKNQILVLLIYWSFCFFIINAFEIVSNVNSFGSESLSLLLFLIVAWCAQFHILLCSLLFKLWLWLFLFIWHLLGIVQSRV